MQILVVDLGGQYPLLIKRRLKEFGVRSEIVRSERVEAWLASHSPKGVILSGGAASIYSEDAPQLPYSLILLGKPMLGICLGMQWLVKRFGGTVIPAKEKAQYGPAKLTLAVKEDFLFYDVPREESIVWMSHGDSVEKLYPYEMQTLATADGVVAAVKVLHLPFWGLQFHPEVEHTEYGKIVLKNFLDFCKAAPDSEPANAVVEIRREMATRVPEDAVCLVAYSGGVDSSVAVKLIKDIPRKVIGVTIDAGHLREGELEEIRANAEELGIPLHVIDARESFFSVLKGLEDPENKRREFKRVYWGVLESISIQSGKTSVDTRFLIHGSIAPDRIESAQTGGAHIKSHHNIAESIHFISINPLESFFKDEVRAIGRALGLSERITEREPFPGPGFFCRVLGEVTSEKVEILCWADARVREIIREEKLTKDISQLVVALGPKITAVTGDQRRYAYSIFVRAVKTSDYMTAEGIYFDEEIFRKIERALLHSPDIAGVLLSPGHKPNQTIEFE